MAYHFERVRILVVEDNKPMLEIIKSLLLTFGVGEVITAKNGAEGYDLFCRHDPDIIIADWMMHPIDGIALCKKIRNRPDSINRFVPILLMTGYSERKRVFHARDAGITEFLVKPFTAQDLYKRLVQIIERPRQFVKSTDFFGPDRRRTSDADYSGPDRREGSERRKGPDKEKMAQAALELEELRRKSGLEKKDKIIIINPDDEIDFV